MKVYLRPERALWDEIVRRPVLDWRGMQPVIEPVRAAVRAQGDQALLALTEKYDGIKLDTLAVTPAAFAAAEEAGHGRLAGRHRSRGSAGRRRWASRGTFGISRRSRAHRVACDAGRRGERENG